MQIDALKQHIPIQVFRELPQVIDTYEFTTPSRLAHFLGQCSHESSNFTRVFENLNYSATALLQLFPHRVKDTFQAQRLERRPEDIANLIYGSRMGNGPQASGDGWKYRGRGYIQLTGKVNYASFDRTVEDDIVEFPDLVATKYPLTSAGWFWKTRNVNRLCLTIADNAIMRVTKLVNGGSHGLARRIQLTKHFHQILSGESSA